DAEAQLNPPDTRARLFGLMRPFAGTFTGGMALAFVAAVLDTTTIVLLIPLLTQLFGTAGAVAGNTTLEQAVNRLLAPIIVGEPREVIILRLVLLFVSAILVKNVVSYASAYLSVLVQEGMVKDLRVRLYRHLLRVDLNVMQRTRGGQIAAAL